MSWQKVKLGQFLKNREGRYKPKDPAIQGLKRIEKIDFSGTIYLSDKVSNTDMILVKKGDLVISGINVEKGAMNIYQGEEDVVATIHYSSYEFDEKQIDIDFLTNFLKSLEFKKALKEQVPGGIKTEIKPKHILPLEVEIPTDVEEQRKVVKKLNENNSIIEDVSSEITHQLDLIKQLRQAFLREAMQGKLVRSSELRVGSETGHELLAKIKAEKAQLIAEKKLKKEKELPPITEDEIPFEIPEHWAWCRLGEISNIQRGSSPRPKGDSRYFAKSQTSYNWITISDISSFCEGNKLKQTREYLTEEGSKHSRFVDKNEFIIAVSGSTTGKCCLTGIDGFIYDGLAVVKQINSNLPSEFLMNYMTYLYAHINNSKSGASFPNINTDFLNNLIYPIPPLHEQEQIVAKLEELMAFCDGLEQSIKESQGYNEKLLQQVLREALQPQ